MKGCAYFGLGRSPNILIGLAWLLLASTLFISNITLNLKNSSHHLVFLREYNRKHLPLGVAAGRQLVLDLAKDCLFRLRDLLAEGLPHVAAVTRWQVVAAADLAQLIVYREALAHGGVAPHVLRDGVILCQSGRVSNDLLAGDHAVLDDFDLPDLLLGVELGEELSYLEKVKSEELEVEAAEDLLVGGFYECEHLSAIKVALVFPQLLLDDVPQLPLVCLINLHQRCVLAHSTPSHLQQTQVFLMPLNLLGRLEPHRLGGGNDERGWQFAYRWA